MDNNAKLILVKRQQNVISGLQTDFETFFIFQNYANYNSSLEQQQTS
jgi:hypothetical protein